MESKKSNIKKAIKPKKKKIKEPLTDEQKITVFKKKVDDMKTVIENFKETIRGLEDDYNVILKIGLKQAPKLVETTIGDLKEDLADIEEKYKQVSGMTNIDILNYLKE